MKRIRSAGRALSLRVKFQGPSLVQLTVLDSVTQETLQFLIPLKWDNEPLPKVEVLEENGLPQNTENLGFSEVETEDPNLQGEDDDEEETDSENSEEEDVDESDNSSGE